MPGKTDVLVMKAIKAQNSGHHTQAAYLFRQAGNQYGNPSEKKELWKAADRAKRVAESD